MAYDIDNLFAIYQDNSQQQDETNDHYHISHDLIVTKSSISKIYEVNDCNICIAEECDDEVYIVFAQTTPKPTYLGYAYFPNGYERLNPVIELDDENNFIPTHYYYHQLYDTVYATMGHIANYHKLSRFSDELFLRFYDTNTGFDRNCVYCRLTQNIRPNDLGGSINYDSTANKIEFIARGLTSVGEEVFLYWTFNKYDDDGDLIAEECRDWECPHKFRFL